MGKRVDLLGYDLKYLPHGTLGEGEIIGEMFARLCDDGNEDCEAFRRIGTVIVRCRHPEHLRYLRTQMHEEMHPELYEDAWRYEGLSAIITSYGPMTYSNIPRHGTITDIADIEP